MIVDPEKPKGDFEEQNFYWPLTLYYHNRFLRFLPISPQVIELEGEG